jgi:RND family efflux transporter MFP subunit
MRRLAHAVLLAIGAGSCGREAERPATRPGAEPPRAIAAIAVGGGEAGGWYRAAGVVRAQRRAELATRSMGRIETVRVRAGDRVKAGQVLATMDRSSLLAARQQSGAGLDLASANLRRMERLFADSAIPIAQLELARAQFAQAQGQANAAAAELTYGEIVAPFAGTVTARLADPGDLAVPGRPLLVVEDEGLREIVVSAPEPVARALRAGTEVSVEIGAEARRITARVAAVVPAADPATRSVEIRLSTPEKLISNLPAVAAIPTRDSGPRPPAIPATALVERDQLTGVYLFAPDSTVRLRWIRIGRRTAEGVEVVSGLNAGDLIVRQAAGARDGERARPVTGPGAER